ncbi:alpha/beta fold hydrolase [Edaphobacter dinghuensis]|uniref:Alpha/beta hydrolase n=1 Tax=Edaphobacter dinghuensis TaxID=1560005 RepID=A0A917M6B4_9BACT|nr:alpha/beta fold hydrolase [Edaphobacter dinghuensis]GGG80185.1 alpha/beta hydrolase [Edaphobacter dinghuensis]
MRRGLRVVVLLLLVCVAAAAVVYCFPLELADQALRFDLWRAGVHSKYIQAGSYRMHYLEASPSGNQGTPLLLIHGLGARGDDWAPMIPALAARGFHVYAPDLPGYGRSGRPDASYSISMEEAAVLQFMQAVHLTRADVGGWSMGGWVAMKLALDHPQVVNRLVVYDSAGIYFPATFGPELFTPDDVAGVRKLMAMLTPHPQPMPDFVARAALRKLQRNAWVVRRGMVSMTNGRDLLDFRLNNMQPPTLVVWGAQDELIPLSIGQTIHQDIPHSVLNIMEGCGHLAPATCARPVVESTVAFLKADPPMQGGEKTFPAEH